MSTIAQPSGAQNLVYGAKELKEVIRQNTVKGLIVALVMFILIALLFFVKAMLSDVTPVKLKTAPFAKNRRMVDLPPPPSSETAPPPPPPPTQQVVLPGPAARAGTPVPVPDAMIPPDMMDFANVNDLSKASSKGGDGSSEFAFDDFGGDLGPPSDVVIEQKIEEPDPYEFISVEQEPYIDIAELQRKVVYPPLAIRAGVEGKVFIRVLVGPNGKPIKAMVEQSDSELLEKAAQKAVMDSQFTPAIQNGKPVQCWVSIPVSFKLK